MALARRRSRKEPHGLTAARRLQHEPQFVPPDVKVSLLDAFARAGFTRIEATSHSHPDRVPAFRDASEVLRGVARPTGEAYKATCPNARAVNRALLDLEAGFGADELSLLISATEGHTARNLRATREQQWARITEMVQLVMVSPPVMEIPPPLLGEFPLAIVRPEIITLLALILKMR